MKTLALRLVSLLAVSICPAVAQEDKEKTDQTLSLAVSSVQAIEEGTAFRVTLSGKSDAEEGEALSFRILPILYRLDADEKSLARIVQEPNSVTVGAQVKKGSFKTEFRALSFFEHEVRVSQGPTAKPLVREITIFDADILKQRYRTETELFTGHLNNVQRFISDLEPIAQRQERVPPKQLKRLRKIEESVRAWADRTEFSAAGGVLANLVTELIRKVPWDADDPSVPPDGPYAPPPKSDPVKFDLNPFVPKLSLAREVGFRETALRILTGLENGVTAFIEHANGGRPKDAQASAEALRGIFTSLASGEFSDCYQAHPLSKGMTDLIEEVERAIRAAPGSAEPLGRQAVDEMKALDGRLKAAIEAVARPKNP